MNVKLIKTFTLVDEHGNWLNTCINESDAVTYAEEQEWVVKKLINNCKQSTNIFNKFINLFKI